MQTQIAALTEAIQSLNARLDAWEERYGPNNPIHLCSNEISNSKSKITSTPLFGVFTDVPKVIDEPNRESNDNHFEVKREPNADQIEELIYEPNPDDFYFSDDEDDDQIVGKPFDEIVATTEVIFLDEAHISSDITEVPIGTIGLKNMPKTFGASVDFVFSTLKLFLHLNLSYKLVHSLSSSNTYKFSFLNRDISIFGDLVEILDFYHSNHETKRLRFVNLQYKRSGGRHGKIK